MYISIILATVFDTLIALFFYNEAKDLDNKTKEEKSITISFYPS